MDQCSVQNPKSTATEAILIVSNLPQGRESEQTSGDDSKTREKEGAYFSEQRPAAVRSVVTCCRVVLVIP